MPGGILVNGAGATVRQMRPLTAALKLTDVSSVRLVGLRIKGNGDDYVRSSSVYAAAGIFVTRSRDVRIIDCDIENMAGAGIRLEGCRGVRVAGCKIVGVGAKVIRDATFQWSVGIRVLMSAGAWTAETE